MTPSPRRLVWTLAVVLAAIGLTVSLVHRFVAQPYVVAGGSMAPTIVPGDRVLVKIVGYGERCPEPGEIVLMLGPGDVVMIKRVAEPPAPPHGGVADASAGFGDDPRRVWVLGDNRGASADSRHFGPVSCRRILGGVRWRYWPLPRAGPIP